MFLFDKAFMPRLNHFVILPFSYLHALLFSLEIHFNITQAIANCGGDRFFRFRFFSKPIDGSIESELYFLFIIDLLPLFLKIHLLALYVTLKKGRFPFSLIIPNLDFFLGRKAQRFSSRPCLRVEFRHKIKL